MGVLQEIVHRVMVDATVEYVLYGTGMLADQAAKSECVCGKDVDAKAVCKCSTKKTPAGVPVLK